MSKYDDQFSVISSQGPCQNTMIMSVCWVREINAAATALLAFQNGFQSFCRAPHTKYFPPTPPTTPQLF